MLQKDVILFLHQFSKKASEMLPTFCWPETGNNWEYVLDET
jgi:hypothetical protein